jgi:hypothetical protein
MRKTEQKLWDGMRNNAPKTAWLQRIENVVAPGTTDVMVIIDGVVSFVELKACAAWPARASTPLLGNGRGLNPDQVNWLLDCVSFDGNAWVLIGVGNGRERELFMVHGAHARVINKMTREELATHRMTWDEVFEFLRDKT